MNQDREVMFDFLCISNGLWPLKKSFNAQVTLGEVPSEARLQLLLIGKDNENKDKNKQ